MDNVYFTRCILHNMLLVFDGLDVLETGVDWAGADGSTDKDVRPLPSETSTSGVGQSAETVEVDSTFVAFRDQLEGHFIYKANRRELCWMYVR